MLTLLMKDFRLMFSRDKNGAKGFIRVLLSIFFVAFFVTIETFLFSEILKKIGNKKFTIQRSKGLGENEPDMMWRTTMCPQTRRLVAVTPTDAEATVKMFDVLLGDALAERKKFIAENGHRYIKDADI